MSQYWPAVLFILQGLMAWGIWSMRRAFAPREELDKLAQRVAGQKQAIAATAAKLDALPSHQDVGGLRQQIEVVAGDLKAVKAEVAGGREMRQSQAATLQRIEDYLLRGSR